MPKALFADESGVTMVEYGIIVALIAALCILVIKALGSKANSGFSNVDAHMP